MKEVELLTIGDFVKMVGFKRAWFYKHAGDPGMPQRVYPHGEPRLVLSECRAFIEALKHQRRPARRGRGRPRKQLTLPTNP